MKDVEAYLSKLTPDQTEEYERIKGIILGIVPDAAVGMSYGMPVFKYRQKYLIGFAVFKEHLSLFPGAGPVLELQDQLTGYKLSKGTIQFTLEHKLPENLVRAIIMSSLKSIV
jgi:uncharacterized protein YdhG (YjbR/CyaY superfamily)